MSVTLLEDEDTILAEIVKVLRARIERLRAEAKAVSENPRIEEQRKRDMVYSLNAYRMGVREALLLIQKACSKKRPFQVVRKD